MELLLLNKPSSLLVVKVELRTSQHNIPKDQTSEAEVKLPFFKASGAVLI